MKLKYKKHSSLYELYYVKWCGIDYDRDKLKKFINTLNRLRILAIFSSDYRKEFKLMKKVISLYDEDKIKNLLDNKENTSRLSIIEKWARIGSIEILTTNLFTKETYKVITNLPISDYQLIIKRIQELRKIGRETTTQSDDFSNNTPGL